MISLCLCGLLLCGCTLESARTPAPRPTDTAAAEGSAAAFSPAYPWTDENMVMSGICFEAAWDAAGRVFVLRTADDLARFYDLADESRLCRRPVARGRFDFSGGRVLVGLWSAGTGCTARHDVAGAARDDAARRLTIQLRFVTEGECSYQLARPFWIGLAGAGDYAVSLDVIR